MKYMIISDIHGSYGSLQKSIQAFNDEKADMLIICGDFLNHGPRNNIPSDYSPKDVAALLNEFKKKIICVRGNCDSEVDQMLLEFPVLESSTSIFAQLKNNKHARLFIHHGHLMDEAKSASLLEGDTIVISGHTHIPLLKKEYGFIFLNPGSISIPKNDSKAGYATITIGEMDKDYSLLICLKEINGKVIKSISV